jgi:predicted component of viral defense system (DUF524 family)
MPHNSGPTWSGSYTTSLNPDFSISISPGKPSPSDVTHWLHFDAKYRLTNSELKQQNPPATGGPPSSEKTFQQSDIHKMHTYRDAVLGCRGAFVLFPGTIKQEAVFIRIPGMQYKNAPFKFPSVGAFPLTPALATGQMARLETFIKHCLDELATSKPYREEHGLY